MRIQGGAHLELPTLSVERCHTTTANSFFNLHAIALQAEEKAQSKQMWWLIVIWVTTFNITLGSTMKLTAAKISETVNWSANSLLFLRCSVYWTCTAAMWKREREKILFLFRLSCVYHCSTRDKKTGKMNSKVYITVTEQINSHAICIFYHM